MKIFSIFIINIVVRWGYLLEGTFTLIIRLLVCYSIIILVHENILIILTLLHKVKNYIILIILLCKL